ncbi:hypothetical protein CDD83_8255 [Cordyceps sp. RAO-2017]|nr:hypothetical protein CDD83_8255 [Cordyceps sp. RAO-2017]
MLRESVAVQGPAPAHCSRFIVPRSGIAASGHLQDTAGYFRAIVACPEGRGHPLIPDWGRWRTCAMSRVATTGKKTVFISAAGTCLAQLATLDALGGGRPRPACWLELATRRELPFAHGSRRPSWDAPGSDFTEKHELLLAVRRTQRTRATRARPKRLAGPSQASHHVMPGRDQVPPSHCRGRSRDSLGRHRSICRGL